MIPTISNISWLAGNARRAFPFYDRADRLDDTSLRLPEEVVTDLSISVPASSDSSVVVYLGGASISSVAVGLAICAEIDGTKVFLASVAIPLPAGSGKAYPLVPAVAGVHGWVCTGARPAAQPQAYRFSASGRTDFLPRCVHRYTPISAISSVNSGLGRDSGAHGLQGVVKIRSGSPELLVVERAAIQTSEGVKNALVLRLNETGYGQSLAQTYKSFLGPDEADPGNLDCDRLAIRRINDVVPDCDGVITLRFVSKDPLRLVGYWNGEISGTPGPDKNINGNLAVVSSVSPLSVCDRPGPVLDQVQNDPCDPPCVDWTGDSPLHTPITVLGWGSGIVSEKYFNGFTSWVKVGSLLSYSVAGVPDTATFTFDGSSDDILILLPISGAWGTVSETVDTSGTSHAATILLNGVAANCIAFNSTSGWILTAAGGGNPPTAVKHVKVGGTTVFEIPLGSGSSGAAGDFWVGPGSISTFGDTFTLADLKAKGFVDSNNNLRFIPVLIPCGWGFATLSVRTELYTASIDPNEDCLDD